MLGSLLKAFAISCNVSRAIGAPPIMLVTLEISDERFVESPATTLDTLDSADLDLEISDDIFVERPATTLDTLDSAIVALEISVERLVERLVERPETTLDTLDSADLDLEISDERFVDKLVSALVALDISDVAEFIVTS